MYSHRLPSKPSYLLVLIIGTLGGVSIGMTFGLETYGFDVVGQVFNLKADTKFTDPLNIYNTLFSSLYVVGIIVSSIFFWLFNVQTRNIVTTGHLLALLGSFVAAASFEQISFAFGVFFLGVSFPFLNYSPFYIIEALSGCRKYVPLHYVGMCLGVVLTSLASIAFANYNHATASLFFRPVWRLLFLLPGLVSVLAFGLFANYANSDESVSGTAEELKTYMSLKYPEKSLADYVKHPPNVLNLVFIVLGSFFTNVGTVCLVITKSDDFLSTAVKDYYFAFHNLFLLSILILITILFFLPSIQNQYIHIFLNLVNIALASVYVGVFSNKQNNYFKYLVACTYFLTFFAGDGPVMYSALFRPEVFPHQKQFLSICTISTWSGALIVFLLGNKAFKTFESWFVGVMIAFSALSVFFSSILYFDINLIGQPVSCRAIADSQLNEGE